MRRLICLLMILVLVLYPLAALCDHAVVLPWPETLTIRWKTETWELNGISAGADVLITWNDALNRQLRDLQTEVWQEAVACAGPGQEIELGSTFRVSGTRWAGFFFTARVIEARESAYRTYRTEETVWLGYRELTMDMETLTPLTLADVISDGSPLWDSVSRDAAELLRAWYPDAVHDEQAVSALTARDALAKASFLPGAGRLMLTLPLQPVLGKPRIARMSLFYSDLREGMTQTALLQTDNSARPVLALTYDDGPSLRMTKMLLRSLNRNGAAATFFPIGQQVAKWPDLTRREQDLGHTVGNHTMEHKIAYEVGISYLKKDRDACRALQRELTGMAPELFRAPGGIVDKFVNGQVGWPLIGWSQSAGDTGNGSPDTLSRHIANRAANGNIILMHDIHKGSVVMADTYLSELYARGFMFATVDELFSMHGHRPEPNRVYTNGFGPDTGVEEEIRKRNK